MLAIDSRWLLAALPGRLLVAGPDADLSVELDASPDALQALVDALAAGAGRQELGAIAGLAPEQFELLARHLEERGALAAQPEPEEGPPGSALADALLDALAGADSSDRHVWTADELLVLPDAGGPTARRRTLRAFVGGMESHARMAAYCHLLRRARRTVRGDVPEAAELSRALQRASDLDPARAHVVSLEDLRVQSAPPGGADAREVHRLGPVTEALELPPPRSPRLRLVLCMARTSHPNLRHPGTGHGWSTGIAPAWRGAELIARAESAERYAAGDVSEGGMVRAAAAELDGALDPAALHSYNQRQLAGPLRSESFRPERRYLWTATTAGGRVPTGHVFTPFADPEGAELPRPGSSGVAAHAMSEEARHRALYELIERDAFMWTWVQRVARERINPAGLPALPAAHVRAASDAGWTVTLLNLTLDLKPVILCVLEERDGVGLIVGAACAETPEAAAGKAVVEALALLWADPALLTTPVEREAVLLPLDHLRFHRGERAREERAWLLSSDDTIELGDVRGHEGPVEDVVSGVGEPSFVDLSSRTTRPFAVFRAFVPGLVPISFGFDREPLGMTRLAEPQRTAAGPLLGQALDLREAGPIMPHPFS